MNKEIKKQEERIRYLDMKRLAYRKKIESLPICPLCGGKIKEGKCRGDGLIQCGLYFK